MATAQILPAILNALRLIFGGQRFSRVIGASALNLLRDEQSIAYLESDGLFKQQTAGAEAFSAAAPARKHAILQQRHL